jgi:hypothetical protein
MTTKSEWPALCQQRKGLAMPGLKPGRYKVKRNVNTSGRAKKQSQRRREILRYTRRRGGGLGVAVAGLRVAVAELGFAEFPFLA